MELPNCCYPMPPINITPSAPTPNHTLYLTNLDDNMFNRFHTNFLYLFKKSVEVHTLKSSLSRVLVDYYPLAGRLRTSTEDESKLVLDCNGEGALFAEASMDITLEELLKYSMVPNSSWKKFKFDVESKDYIDTPSLSIQVTNLCCGGMVLYISITHVLCDAIGTSLFMNAWAELTRKPNSNLITIPSHDRQVLNISKLPQVNLFHPIFTKTPTHSNPESNILTWILTQSFVPTSFIFGANEVARLKKQCTTSSLNDITSFEAIAAHMWRSLMKALNIPISHVVKLCFLVNIRNKMKLSEGYYGNGFVSACAESTIKDLVAPNNLDHCVELVQKAKAGVDEEYIKSTIDVLKDKEVTFDGSISLSISQLKRLGLEDVDFGQGKPLHIGPLSAEFFCIFSPIIGDANAVRMLISVPQIIVEKFQHYMINIECWDRKGQINFPSLKSKPLFSNM